MSELMQLCSTKLSFPESACVTGGAANLMHLHHQFFHMSNTSEGGMCRVYCTYEQKNPTISQSYA